MGKPDRIYLDMDDVIVQFVPAVMELFDRPPELSRRVTAWDMGAPGGIASLLGVTEDDVWDRINQKGEKFWSNLLPFWWTDDLIDLCRKTAPLTILTTPSLHHSCVAGKLKWLQGHFGHRFRDYVFAPHKYLLGRPGVVLIDDRLKNVEEWEERGGSGILFPASHNYLGKYFSNGTGDPVDHVREELAAIIG